MKGDKPTPKKWERAPKSREAARAEVGAIDRRTCVDTERRRVLMDWLRALRSTLPPPGSRWVRTLNWTHMAMPRSRARDHQHELIFLHCGRTSDDRAGQPALVFEYLGVVGRSVRNGPRKEVVVVSLDTFALEFDPAPTRRSARSGR